MTADLVRTAVELANREVEVAQLRHALVGRVWIEQAKGVLAGTQGISPDTAFQQLRARARSSRRKLADLAQEVVQDAQRERIAAVAAHDAIQLLRRGRIRTSNAATTATTASVRNNAPWLTVPVTAS